MISVEDALCRLFDLVHPLSSEPVPLAKAVGRFMAHPVAAGRDQPPFAASAMDGYAICGDAAHGARFEVVGTASAGHRYLGTLDVGQAARIFTGAPVPSGTSRVVIQEDVTRKNNIITLNQNLDQGLNIRPQGQDFRKGDVVSPRLLRPTDLALLASMNVANVSVVRRPVVALIATGDELVMPGETPRPDQIIASNTFALAAMIELAGATARLLPIARDNEADLRAVLGLTQGTDLIVTIGGASVGDHDIVGTVAQSLGLEQTFYRVAIRPGKPLMAGRLGGIPMVGLPGNPVSSIVCGHVFILPMIRAMLGQGAQPAARKRAVLGADIGANGQRAHYMRAKLAVGSGLPQIVPFTSQDSALLGVLAAADALLIRPVGDGPQSAGTEVDFLPI